MTKKAGNSLQAMLNRAASTAPDPAQPDAPAVEVSTPEKRGRGRPSLASTGQAPAKRAPSRGDTQMIGGHLPRELGKQLRILAAEEDTTVVALLEEAITDLLTKKAARQARR
jgi:hypothetical protein